MKNLDKIAIGCLYVMVISIYYSRFLLSVSMIVFVALAILKFLSQKSKTSKGIKPFIAYAAFFLVALVSMINTTDLGAGLHHVRMRLPFLLLPLAAFVFKDQIVKDRLKLIAAFFCLAIISTIPVLLEMWDFESLVKNIGRGQSANTPIDHIKYSLFLAFATFIGVIFLVEENADFIQKVKPILIFLITYLVIFLHVLSVRSGLVVFYAGSIFLLLKYAIALRKKWLYPLALFILVLPMIAVNTIPSLNKKMQYMVYDFQMFQKGEGKTHSDSERLYSIMVGFNLFKSSPLLGVGFGDLRQKCEEAYKELFNLENDKYPHNQFLFYLAGGGILGFGLFLFGMYYPALHFRKRLDSYFLMLLVLLSISFLVENTLERSYSIGFFLFFAIISLCRMSSDYFNEAAAFNPQSK